MTGLVRLLASVTVTVTGSVTVTGTEHGGTEVEVGGAERMGGEAEVGCVQGGTELDSRAILALSSHPVHITAIPALLRRDVRDKQVVHAALVPPDRTPRRPARHASGQRTSLMIHTILAAVVREKGHSWFRKQTTP
eukprot:704296-Rhodomonas_salina.1